MPAHHRHSSRGMGLPGMIVATGIGAVVALGMASVITNLLDGQNTVKYRSQVDTVTDEIRATLSSPVACRNTFGGLSLNGTINHSVQSIRDASAGNGAALFARDSVYGDRSLRITGLSLHDYNHETGMVGWANLRVSYIAQQQGTGPSELTRTIRLRTERDASNNLSSCTALAKMSDGLWQRVSSSPNDIFFQQIGSGGKVGIGTAVPQSALQISGAASGSSSTAGVHLGMSANYASIELKGGAGAAGGGFIDFGFPGNDFRGRILYDNSANSMGFHTSGAQQMTISSSGNLGLGVTNPTQKLEINGTSKASAYRAAQGAPTATDSSTTGYAFGDDGDTGIFSPGAGNSFGQVAIMGNSNEVARFLPNGRVGIGTTNPQTALQVNGLIRMGTDGSTPCNSDLTGTIRYNSGPKAVEFCDGSNWKNVGGGNGCDAMTSSASGSEVSVDGCGHQTSGYGYDNVRCPAAEHGRVVSCPPVGVAQGHRFKATFHCWDGAWSQAGAYFKFQNTSNKCSCFSAATFVTMADGSHLLITQVKVGDLVRAANGEINRVVALDRAVLNEVAGQFYMRINDELETWVTNNHPILTTEGWKALQVPMGELEAIDQLQGRLGQLRVGDEMILEDGQTLKVTSLQTVIKNRSERLYNLVVDGDHTFFANGVAVHGYVPSTRFATPGPVSK